MGDLKGLAEGKEGTQELLRMVLLSLENAVMSFAGHIELDLCLKDLKASLTFQSCTACP